MTYNDTRVQRTIFDWVKTQKTDLTSDENIFLKKFFLDGLNIGILAEWRAWIVTSAYLQLLMKAGLVRELPPDFEFLRGQGFGSRLLTYEEVRHLWWQHLQERFYLPTEGLWSCPWLSGKLKEYFETWGEKDLALSPELLKLLPAGFKPL